MDFISLLTVVAFLLIGVDVSRKNRGPGIMITGLALLAASVVARLFSGGGFFETLTPLFSDVGLSLLVAAGWIAIRKGGARPFFMLGVLSLGVAGLLHLGNYFSGTRFNSEASFLLELGPDDQIEEVASVLEKYGAHYERAFPNITLSADEDLAQVYLIYGESARFELLMEALRSDTENVDFVELNSLVSLSPPAINSERAWDATRQYLENDPRVGEQWALEAIRGHEAHALLRDLTPVRKAKVAIVDTGVDSKHEDLKSVFSKSKAKVDRNGHGTHCAGIAGAATNNGKGIASLNWEGRFVEILGYEALGPNGTGTLETIAQAILDAARADADVISMSLGSTAPLPPRVLVNAIEFAQKRGAIVVASAGNSNRDAYDHFPSNIANVMAIAAVDQNLKKARFSNTTARLQWALAAPGVDVLSTMPNGAYKNMSGTSMATPVVTGLLGVMRSLNPDLTAEQAYTILHETGATVEDTRQVGRVINAEASIQAVLGAL